MIKQWRGGYEARVAYAALLVAAAIWQLMGVGGFDFAFISYRSAGDPILVLIVAGLAIAALPFLFELRISRRARMASMYAAVIAPVAFVLHMVFVGIPM